MFVRFVSPVFASAHDFVLQEFFGLFVLVARGRIINPFNEIRIRRKTGKKRKLCCRFEDENEKERKPTDPNARHQTRAPTPHLTPVT